MLNNADSFNMSQSNFNPQYMDQSRGGQMYQGGVQPEQSNKNGGKGNSDYFEMMNKQPSGQNQNFNRNMRF